MMTAIVKLNICVCVVFLLFILESRGFVKPGACPSVEDVITTCEFNSEVNCSDDAQCKPQGRMCCPYGCGRRCVEPVYNYNCFEKWLAKFGIIHP